MKKIIDLTGQKFGRLFVIKEVHKHNGSRYWLCRCECGNYKEIAQLHLRNGSIKSCGCYRKEFLNKCRTKHNKRHTKIYHIYAGIKRRCFNKNDKFYKYYGGRGITICKKWLDSKTGFIDFYNWSMKNGYKDGLTIDRIDVNGNYEPDNCRWVTMEVQVNNRRNTIYLQYKGIKHSLSEWCKITNLSRSTILHRLERGWSIEKTLSTPKLR